MARAAPPGPCVACGASIREFVLAKNDFELVRCGVCDLVQISPVAPLVQYANYYRKTAHHAEEEARNAAGLLARDRAVLTGLRARGAAGPLLDVGAGLGLLSRAAVELGLEPTALEVSDTAAAELESVPGLKVRRGTLEAADLPDEGFGVVVLSHTFEHLTAPRSALDLIHAALRPGGLLHIAVPNWRSIKRWVAGADLGWIGNEHISYFTSSTLTALVESAGFAVDDCHVRPYVCERDDDFALALAGRLRLRASIERFVGLDDGALRAFAAGRAAPSRPSWRARLVAVLTRGFLAAWPDRVFALLGIGDELRLTARRVDRH